MTSADAQDVVSADSLEQLRSMLPYGLTRRDRTSIMPLDVLETWD